MDEQSFRLACLPGVVIANDERDSTAMTSHGGGGVMAFGFGVSRPPRLTSSTVHHQRIAVRTAARDVFLERTGAPLPVACGQQVEIVAAVGSSGRPSNIALINRSSRQWWWLSSALHAGEVVAPPALLWRDRGRYALAVVLLALLAWVPLGGSGSILGMAAYFLLALPAILGGATVLLFRGRERLGAAIAAELNRRLAAG